MEVVARIFDKKIRARGVLSGTLAMRRPD